MSLSLVVGGISRGSRGAKGGEGDEESETHHLFSENIFPPDAHKMFQEPLWDTQMLPVEGAEAICEFFLLRRVSSYIPCPLALHDDLLQPLYQLAIM